MCMRQVITAEWLLTNNIKNRRKSGLQTKTANEILYARPRVQISQFADETKSLPGFRVAL